MEKTSTETTALIGEAVQRDYPYLRQSTPVISSVQSQLKAQRKGQPPPQDMQIVDKIRTMREMMAGVITPTAIPAATLTASNITSEIRDILGFNRRQAQLWATEADHVLEAVQTDNWSLLTPEAQHFAQTNLEEFNIRVLELTFSGSRRRWQ